MYFSEPFGTYDGPVHPVPRVSKEFVTSKQKVNIPGTCNFGRCSHYPPPVHGRKTDTTTHGPVTVPPPPPLDNVTCGLFSVDTLFVTQSPFKVKEKRENGKGKGERKITSVSSTDKS